MASLPNGPQRISVNLVHTPSRALAGPYARNKMLSHRASR